MEQRFERQNKYLKYRMNIQHIQNRYSVYRIKTQLAPYMDLCISNISSRSVLFHYHTKAVIRVK